MPDQQPANQPVQPTPVAQPPVQMAQPPITPNITTPPQPPVNQNTPHPIDVITEEPKYAAHEIDAMQSDSDEKVKMVKKYILIGVIVIGVIGAGFAIYKFFFAGNADTATTDKTEDSSPPPQVVSPFSKPANTTPPSNEEIEKSVDQLKSTINPDSQKLYDNAVLKDTSTPDASSNPPSLVPDTNSTPDATPAPDTSTNNGKIKR